MSESHIDDFIAASYEGKAGESLDFDMDAVRARVVLRDALRDQPQYFVLDLLAAANLAGSKELRI